MVLKKKKSKAQWVLSPVVPIYYSQVNATHLYLCRRPVISPYTGTLLKR